MSTPENAKAPEVTDVNTAASAIEAMLTGDDGDSEEPNQEGDTPEEEPEAEAEADAPDNSESDEETEPEEEAEGEAEEDQEEENTGEEQTQEPQKVAVKVDGEEIEVTLDELKAGYSRTADYTRKTMAVAEDRKALDDQVKGLEQEREQYKAVLTVWEQQLKASLGQESDEELIRLRQDNPGEYSARVAERQDAQQRLNAIIAEQQRLESDNQQRATEEQKTLVRQEGAKLIEAVPELADPKTAGAERDRILDYGMSYGYTPQDLAQVTDHRWILIMRDAARYREIASKANTAKANPKPKVEKVKTATPGAAKQSPNQKSSQITRAKNRFSQTHHVRDAARVIEGLLPDNLG